MPDRLLEIRGLHVGYESIEILKGVDLTIDVSERIGIFGPNGHGKSTMLDTICGLLKPWSGEILLKGRRIDTLSPRQIMQAGIVHVCQGNTMFARMTVLENLYCGAFHAGKWKNRRPAAEKVYEIFPQLAERRSQRASTLSGGERQMLAIGAGLMAGGELLMLDEPTLGLAPSIRDELSAAIDKAVSSGMAIMLVEQDFDFLSQLVHRLFMLEEGRVVFEGRVEDLSESRIMEMYFGGAANSEAVRQRMHARDSGGV
jgi:branched-chain amino acid transport system ATP-binding protein